jgi:3-dehydrotetronate 4-kinase
MALLLGCIGDDHTGSSDLANTLVKNGLRTVQVIGVPSENTPVPDAEAIVIALKSRTTPAAEAMAESVAALKWLKQAGARQFFFKYCSTFDSTDDGNIGPVTEALMAELGADITIACPAFPTTGRTIYNGHLFVFGDLLSDSSMRNHPLTPMTDANLVRVLQRQTKLPVGLVAAADVMQGSARIKAALNAATEEGTRIAIVDAISDDQLYDIGTACAGLELITGGSGIACGLPENFRRAGLVANDASAAAHIPDIPGHEAVIAGSCSSATLAQLAHAERSCPVLRIDPVSVMSGADVAAEALAWAEAHLGNTRPIFAASADPDQVATAQQQFGRMEIGEALEHTLAKIAQGLVEKGVRRLVVAGGETSGAVVQALDITTLRIGPEIDPGVPWCETLNDPKLALALKSGNFGAEDFFTKSFEMLTKGRT